MLRSLRYAISDASLEKIKLDFSKMKAVSEMPSPTNISELRRVLGLINYLGKILLDLYTTLCPITDLLHKDTAWTWGEPQEQAFARGWVNNSVIVSDMLSGKPLRKETTSYTDEDIKAFVTSEWPHIMMQMRISK